MIEEKTKRSKTHCNKEIGECAKSVQSPIVLLERLHIGANTLPKEAVAEKRSNSVKFDKEETPLVGEQKSKKSVLRNSSAIILNDSKNKKTSTQCNPTETTILPQSTLSDLDGGIALSKTQSCKFKKKLKHLQKVSSNLVTDNIFSEKIRQDPKLLNNITTKISTGVSTEKKSSKKTKADDDKKFTVSNDSEQHNLKTNSLQEQINTEVSMGGQVFDNSKLLNATSATKETTQLKTSRSTRSRSLKNLEVDDCQNSSVENSLPDNSTESNLSTVNASPVKISSESLSMKKNEKLILNETTGAIENNDAKNIIKTRSKGHEKVKADNSKSPSVTKSTPKRISNKSSLNEKLLQHGMKIISTTQSQQNDLDINLTEVQTNNKPSLAKTLDNLKLTTDTTIQKETPVRSMISTRSKLQGKMEIDYDKNLKPSKSAIRNKSLELVKSVSKSDTSQIQIDSHSSSSKNIHAKLKVETDSLKIKENQIVKNNVSTRNKLLKKKIIDSDKIDTVGNVVMQSKENNSTSISSQIQMDNESSISENVLDHSMSSTDLSKVEEKINERKRIPTRSKTLEDKKNIPDPEKNITENNLLQTEKAQPAKSLQSRKSNVSLKSVDGSLKTKEKNDTTSNISTRSRLLEKTLDDNKQLTIEKSSSDITLQSEQNQNVSTTINNEISLSETLLDSSKHSDSTSMPTKIDMQNAISTRSKVEKKKTDNHEKSIVENKIIHLNESSPVKITEQLIPNNTVQDGVKSPTDLRKTKENISGRSKSNEKKKKAELEKSDSENKTTQVAQNQTENKISTRSKKFEKNKPDDHENDTPYLETNKFTSNSSEAVIGSKSLACEKVLGNPKRLTKSPKKIEIKSTISTRSKLLEKNGTEHHEESIVEISGAVEQTTSSSHQRQSNNESTLDSNNTADIDDLSNTISTRSGLARKITTNVKPSESKKRSLAKKKHSPSKSQAPNESIVHEQVAENEKKSCNTNIQQRVCYEKKFIIKLFRCDQAQPVNNCPEEKQTPKKKSLRGKRKVEHESPVEETLKAKKSKQVDSSYTDSPVTNEHQPSIVDNQVKLSTIEDIGKLVDESQNSMESNMSDTNIIKSIENVPEIQEETEKDLCLENLSDINIVENTDSVTKSPEISEQENQCDNNRVENEREIIVNSSGDNISVHEEELLENSDEGISVDTSENDTNTEALVNNDNMIVVESTSTLIYDQESHTLLARKMVEEVINDWAVADDDRTVDIGSTGVNQDLSTPEVIQIDDSNDVVMIVDVPQVAVSIEKENDAVELTSHNLIATPRKNVEISTIDISDSSPRQKEKSITVTSEKTVDDKQCNNMTKETRGSNSTSEQTSEMSEIDDNDSNFESVDESSCTDTFANGNVDDENNVSQETITYYNSEDIAMDVGVPVNESRLNDVVMSLKDACDKITADFSRVNASYENNEEASNHHEPELLCISDDSNGEQEEEEEEDEDEVLIIEPSIEAYQPQSPPVEQQSLLISNQSLFDLGHVMQQGSPSISVIKASELRDEMLQPPVEYSIKPTDQHGIVYPQRQMHSTTLLPASMVNETQSFSMLNEDTIMQCPKCRCEFVGKTRLRRHWLTCGDAMYLYCPFCPNKVKQRRSLINHLNSNHSDQVDPHETVKMVEQIVKQTREAAGVKLKQGCHLAIRDFLRTSSTVPIIELPAFIRIQCVVCNKVYDQVPATYKKTCDDCSSDLMTAICQLCRKQYMLSTKVALHVQGNCIFTGRVKCRECGFTSSGRYHLQEHIIRKHIYVAPEDYIVCGLGCGKTFRSNHALKKHERICGKEANLNCRFCNYKTKHRSAMKMHVQQHIVHEKLTVNTDGSIKVFGQPSLDNSQSEDDVRDLITEQQVRSVIRVHCSRCDQTLRLTSNRSSCEFCKLSYTFSCSRCSDSIRLDSLHAARLHVIRSHSVKIHECPHCLQKFSYVYDLTRHASKCTVAKTICCEFCKFRTNHESKLRVHKRRVHFPNGSDRVSCQKCGKWFTRGDSLRRHEKSNCGIVPNFLCEHCHFKTKTKFSLLRHIQSQHAYIYEHFNFVCDRCNKFYTNMFAYEVHVKNCHALVNN